MITPGPVVIIVAFIGYLVAGINGALASALGVFVPVYLVVVLLCPVYKRVTRYAGVQAFVSGVTAAAMGSLLGASILLGQQSITSLVGLGIAIVSAGVGWYRLLPDPVVIIIAGLIGIVTR